MKELIIGLVLVIIAVYTVPLVNDGTCQAATGTAYEFIVKFLALCWLG